MLRFFIIPEEFSLGKGGFPDARASVSQKVFTLVNKEKDVSTTLRADLDKFPRVVSIAN